LLVTQALRIALLQRETEALAAFPTTSVPAYEESISGRAAVELDSLYAEAWAGLANAIALFPNCIDRGWTEWLPRADSTVRRALAINPRLGEAHASLALVLTYRWELEEAREFIERAIEFNPNYAQGHSLRGYLALIFGDVTQARNSAEQALALDPRSVARNYNAAIQYLRAKA